MPEAMEADRWDLFFWASASLSLAIARVIAFPVNRCVIARARDHAVVAGHRAR